MFRIVMVKNIKIFYFWNFIVIIYIYIFQKATKNFTILDILYYIFEILNYKKYNRD